MKPTPAELRAKIVDPEGPLYAEFLQPWGAGDDEGVDAVLNLIRDGDAYLQWRELSRAEVLKVVVGLGAYTSLKAASETIGPLQSVAWGMLTMLTDSTSTWDMGDPGVRALAPALDAIHPAADPFPGLGTALLAIARRPGSYGEKEFGRGYRSTTAEVAAARKAGG